MLRGKVRGRKDREVRKMATERGTRGREEKEKGSKDYWGGRYCLGGREDRNKSKEG